MAVERALAEDLGPEGDLTSSLLPSVDVIAVIVARAAGVLAGRACATEVFRQVDPSVMLRWEVADGDRVSPGQQLAAVTGSRSSVLTAERTALNFLSHLSGIATEVSRYVAAVAGSGRVRDTRKTTPGLRVLEKAAVRAGGGDNHRAGLSEWVMFKDNHLAAITITEGVSAARQRWPERAVYVECDRIEQVDEALAAGADALLFDNMTPQQVLTCVERAEGHDCLLEVSGGITLETVAEYAVTGVDFISVGQLTNSAPALDIALDVV
ncbi:MAG: carboxylating nicotinate-nucleotide diphosphorylase [Acidimicrobiia bacterium]|nr:carboxylating nicotinate-nucleotide diphosphorylase [Acidimicrobiia bacterium]MYC57641.1 carboxylating nicotinate-nucleotide diphosphorylase [Acidimicrobiia bacterium]MYG94441.1 carboxylating nicotinate-nucleotide diphosphorylase [Acidimicrobiia bacterium]MYI30706.1 carboxylating nicotinate-nucleotide diphosphorylase [Acidimicrobiia bacterium]